MFELITIKDLKHQIAAWCKSLRKAENLSQQALANELALSRITISKLENAENITLDTLLKILQYFDQMRSFNEFILSKTHHNKSLY